MTGIIMGLSDEGVTDSFSLFSGSLMRDPVVMISQYLSLGKFFKISKALIKWFGLKSGYL